MDRRFQESERKIYKAVINGELEIDSKGRVWRVAKRGWDQWLGKTVTRKCKRVRAEHKLPSGYLQVRVMFKGDRLHTTGHRLVYFHFKGPIPIGMTVNHKNGKKSDNRPCNLELATYSEQQKHNIYVLGNNQRVLKQNGEKNHYAKLTKRDVIQIRKRRASGEKLKSIGDDYGIAFQHVSRLYHGERWQHLEFPA